MTSNAAGPADIEGRYGPYRIVSELVRAPGAWLVEGHDDSGGRCIVQLARCKPATDPDAKIERDDYVQMTDAATQHLRTDPDVTLLAHGTEDESDGGLMLFWAMPWLEGADRLGRAYVETPGQLATIAVALLERLGRRHERGRLAPTLSEQVLILAPHASRDRREQAVPAGLPLHLPPNWLTNDVPKPRLAPEERSRSEPRLSGDLWRAGRTLRALGAQMIDWPGALKTAIDRLDAESLGDRFTDASVALIEFESLQSTLAAAADFRAPRDRGDTQVNIDPPQDAGDRVDEPASPALQSLQNAPPIGKEAATVRVELTESDRRNLFGSGDGGRRRAERPDLSSFGETLLDQPAPGPPPHRPPTTTRRCTTCRCRLGPTNPRPRGARKRRPPAAPSGTRPTTSRRPRRSRSARRARWSAFGSSTSRPDCAAAKTPRCLSCCLRPRCRRICGARSRACFRLRTRRRQRRRRRARRPHPSSKAGCCPARCQAE